MFSLRPKMSGKRQMSILSCFAMKDQLPKKVARSEEKTVEKAVVEDVDEAVEDTAEEAVEEMEETARVSVEYKSLEETGGHHRRDNGEATRNREKERSKWRSHL
ncbi:unnamed protein product [Boreogadus saida]